MQAKENAGRFPGSFDCCLHTLRSEGVRGLFTGLTTTVWRNSIWNCVYFWSLFEIRQGVAHLSPLTSDTHAPWPVLKVFYSIFIFIQFPFFFLTLDIDAHGTWPVLQTMGEGFFAGLIATSFNAPFDTAKSRIQARAPPVSVGGFGGGGGAGVAEGQSTFAVLREIIRREGAFACYKGFRPKALRMALGAAVALATYETTLKILNPKL